MADFDRDKLTRGVKLQPQHTHGLLDSVGTAMENATLDRDNLDQTAQWVPFRVTIPITYIDSTYCHTLNRNHLFGVPFTLPPLQEEFSITTDSVGNKVPGESTQPVVLDEVMISFDQRGEPAAVADWMHKGISTGTVAYAGVGPNPGDQFTINTVTFTAVNPGPANPAIQEFLDAAAAGSPAAVATSIAAAVNDPATQDLIQDTNDDGAWAIAEAVAATPGLVNLIASRAQEGTAGWPGFTLTESTGGARLAVSGANFTAANAELNSKEGGKIDYDTSGLSIKFVLFEKDPHFLQAEQYDPQDAVVTIFLPPESFSAEQFRQNPFIQSDLNKRLDPYKTYVAALDVTSLRLYDPTDDVITYWKTYCLPNLVISLRCRYPIVSRDVNGGGTTVQNIPSHNNSLALPASGEFPDITVPSAGASIVGDAVATTAVSTAMGEVDEFVNRYGIPGGQNPDGTLPPWENLAVSAGYEVMVIPLFQNRESGGVLADDVLREPYNTAANDQYLWDRRLVRIVNPMTIHHCFLAWNWANWDQVVGTKVSPSIIPNSVTYELSAGLAMVSGFRGDDFNYQQIATTDTMIRANFATWDTGLVDRIRVDGQHNVANKTVPEGKNWAWELHAMPVVGAGGTGYFAQGNPVYVGESIGPTTSSRSNINGTASAVSGTEQFLEARIYVHDPNGLRIVADGGAQNTGSVLVGYGGCYMIVIGKKSLTDGKIYDG